MRIAHLVDEVVLLAYITRPYDANIDPTSKYEVKLRQFDNAYTELDYEDILPFNANS